MNTPKQGDPLSPQSFFLESMKYLPRKFRVLYAVSAIVSLIGMIRVWEIDRGWSIVAALVIIFVAVILSVLQTNSRKLALQVEHIIQPKYRFEPASILPWFVIALFVIWCSLLTSCVFFSWPKPVSDLPLFPRKEQTKTVLIHSLVSNWGNTKYSRNDIPQQLVADIENVLARPELLLATETPSKEDIKSADLIIRNYASNSSKYSLGRRWLDATRDTYRAKNDISSLIQNRLLLVELIVSELKQLPGAAQRSAELVNDGFSIVESIDVISNDIPKNLRGSYNVARIILYIRRAQLNARDGIWHAGDVNQAASIAMQVTDIPLYSVAQVVNAITRAANAATDSKSALDMLESIRLRQRFIDIYRPRFDSESLQVTRDNWGFLVNYAKLEEEQFLFKSYSDNQGNQIETPHWTSEQLERLRNLTRSQERIAAFIQSSSPHDWANISLDVARFYALQYEWLLVDAKRTDEAKAAKDSSVGNLLRIDSAEGVQRTETKRLFTDIINRPEFYNIKNDQRLNSIVTYVKDHGI